MTYKYLDAFLNQGKNVRHSSSPFYFFPEVFVLRDSKSGYLRTCSCKLSISSESDHSRGIPYFHEARPAIEESGGGTRHFWFISLARRVNSPLFNFFEGSPISNRCEFFS
jgi:hypothetical protein